MLTRALVLVVVATVMVSMGSAQPSSAQPGETSVADWARLDAVRQLAYVSGALDMLRRSVRTGDILVLGNPVCTIATTKNATPSILHERMVAYSRADSTPADRPMAEAIIDVLKKDCPRQ